MDGKRERESRGVVEEGGLENFKKCLKHVPANEWKSFLIHLVTIMIEALHKIWMVYEKSSCMKQHFKQVEPFSVTLACYCFLCYFLYFVVL